MAKVGSLFYVFFGIIFMAIIISFILNPANMDSSAATRSESCVDSDGMNYQGKGFVIFKSLTYWDSCIGSQLNERYCYLGKNGKQLMATLAYNCPSGYVCQDGACKPAPAVCGDRVVQAPEECDGYGMVRACTDAYGRPGMQECTGECKYSPCGVEARCGDNVIDLGEECDGTELRGLTCGELGFSYGVLSCFPNCVLDTSKCVRVACGNGVLDQREQCDDGNNINGDGCDQYCMLETVRETDTCTFLNAWHNNFCYYDSTTNVGNCSAFQDCTVGVIGLMNDKAFWSSNCRPVNATSLAAYTLVDGKNKNIYFDCTDSN